MKTITVTDEMHSALMELSKEMVSQDARGTRMPHMFQVRDWKDVPAFEGNGDKVVWVNEDHDEMEELELKAIAKEALYLDEDVKDVDLQDFEVKHFLEGKNYSCYDMDEKAEYTNTFFKPKACQEFLTANHYHYNEKADVYLNHAWRNPEMELVATFLCELSGGKLHT